MMVDGFTVGDEQEVVIRDRQLLAADGMFVIVATVAADTGKLPQESRYYLPWICLPQGKPRTTPRSTRYHKEKQWRKEVTDSDLSTLISSKKSSPTISNASSSRRLQSAH
jgi:mRNA degradation ribonuclease J1/J2